MEDYKSLWEEFEGVMDTTAPDALLPRWMKTFSSPYDFKWVPGVTPFSHFSWPVFGLAGYLLVIVILKYIMSSRDKVQMPTVMRYHNLFLCLWSMAMFFGTSFELLRAIIEDGYSIPDLICDARNGVRGQLLVGGLGFWAYNYYLSKFYELFDTIVVLLRKSKLRILHVYHHIIIMIVTWSWIQTNVAFLWVGLLLNTCVHSFMYWYYYKATISEYRPWWRPYLTIGQIVQFIVGWLNAIYWFYLTLEGVTWNTSYPYMTYKSSRCSGAVWSIGLSTFMLMSFVILFGQMFIADNCTRSGKAAKAARVAKAKAAKAEAKAKSSNSSNNGNSQGQRQRKRVSGGNGGDDGSDAGASGSETPPKPGKKKHQ